MPALNQVDVWVAIQSELETVSPKIGSKEGQVCVPPYVHPLSRQSSRLMSQRSLEICTENLGSETGSEFSSDESSYFSSDSDSDDQSEFQTLFGRNTLSRFECNEGGSPVETGKELMAVNYHGCSGGSSSGRTFPPPLPSIARRDGRPCVRMQPHRQNGRLVVQAVPVRSNTYLHANRHDGRLRLCFVDCASRAASTETTDKPAAVPVLEKQVAQEEVDEKVVIEEEEVCEVEEELEEEEEEVEVVERRTVIEVKVGSTQNDRVHRSTLVINKFLGSTPDAALATNETTPLSSPPMRHPSPPKRGAAATAATSAAAAVVAAASSSSSVSDKEAYGKMYGYNGGDTKLLFTSRRKDKAQLLSSVRCCTELRIRPLFFFEPCCIATS